jgi:LuxR family transcriptional regulator, transcriptional regulator of spore coat protein
MIISQLLDTRPQLSVRECDILECVAIGMSAKEIARHVDLAPRTVERYIENMRLKMHARNSAHMVACGLFYGAINMPS